MLRKLQINYDRIFNTNPFYRLLPYAYHNPFTVKLRAKCVWQNRFKPDIQGGMVWYKDISKTKQDTGAGARKGGITSAPESTHYSRLKYTPLPHM